MIFKQLIDYNQQFNNIKLFTQQTIKNANSSF